MLKSQNKNNPVRDIIIRVRLSKSEHEELAALAELRGHTMSSAIRQLLRAAKTPVLLEKDI